MWKIWDAIILNIKYVCLFDFHAFVASSCEVGIINMMFTI